MKFYAHKKDNVKEKLEDHTTLCKHYGDLIIKEKGIDEFFKRVKSMFLPYFSPASSAIFYDMLNDIPIFHDKGKINVLFQKDVMDNDLNIPLSKNVSYTNHALLSAIFYVNKYYNIIKSIKSVDEKKTLVYFMVLNAFVISRHHSNATSLASFKKVFKADGEGYKILDSKGEIKEVFEKTYDKKLNLNSNSFVTIIKIAEDFGLTLSIKDAVNMNAYVRMVASILVTSDYYSTSDFMNNTTISDFGVIKDSNKLFEAYKKNNLYKAIKSYEKNKIEKVCFNSEKNINVLRSELFLEAEANLPNVIDSNIIYLKAPTGYGKSNTVLNTVMNMINIDKSKQKLFYTYPYNILAEQNHKDIKNVFEGSGLEITNIMATVNSAEPIKTPTENETFINYQKCLLDYQFFNYPIVHTSHVSLFNILFGNRRSDFFPFHQLMNSIIIVDEIQSYKNTIWKEIITFFNGFAKLLNIQFVIMSATLPNLDALSDVKANISELVPDSQRYYQSYIYKHRVTPDFSLLKNDYKEGDFEARVSRLASDIIPIIKEHYNKGQKGIIGFISKRSASAFHKQLVDYSNNNKLNFDVEYLSGNDNLSERNRMLNKFEKTTGPMILISTQIIEAGVNLDADYGIRNISLLDNDEQFIGRINRACLKNGATVYFFKFDEPNKIYRNDVRTNWILTLVNSFMHKLFKNKDFDIYYEKINEILLSNLKSDYNEFMTYVKTMDFEKIEEHMRLIEEDEKKVRVFFNRKIKNKDGVTLEGEKVWENYREVISNNNMDRAEKTVKLSIINADLNYFIHEIRNVTDFIYNDQIGNIYYIDEGEKYFINGKFDKDSLFNQLFI